MPRKAWLRAHLCGRRVRRARIDGHGEAALVRSGTRRGSDRCIPGARGRAVAGLLEVLRERGAPLQCLDLDAPRELVCGRAARREGAALGTRGDENWRGAARRGGRRLPRPLARSRAPAPEPAVMQRREPTSDDKLGPRGFRTSLDYFPTPPWAARAACEFITTSQGPAC